MALYFILICLLERAEIFLYRLVFKLMIIDCTMLSHLIRLQAITYPMTVQMIRRVDWIKQNGEWLTTKCSTYKEAEGRTPGQFAVNGPCPEPRAQPARSSTNRINIVICHQIDGSFWRLMPLFLPFALHLFS